MTIDEVLKIIKAFFDALLGIIKAIKGENGENADSGNN